MTKETQLKLLQTFEKIKRTSDEGMKYWDARELSPILGYERWENFQNVISKAIVSCKVGGVPIEDHFREVTKMVNLGSSAIKDDFS